MSFYLLFVILSLMNVCQSISFTDNRPWVTPCGESKDSNILSVIFPSAFPKTPESEKVREISVKLQETQTRIQDIKNLYLSENNTNRALYRSRDELDSNVFNLVGFPVVKLDIDRALTVPLEKLIEEDYRTLSEILAFLEQAKIAADGYKDRILQPATALLKRAKVQMLGILCNFQDILRDHNKTVTNHVTRDVVPDSVSSIKREQDYEARDFYIMKGTLNILKKLIPKYASLSSTLKGEV